MEVDLRLMQVASATLTDSLIDLIGDRVEVDADYYGAVDPEEALRPYVLPGELGVGQIADCL